MLKHLLPKVYSQLMIVWRPNRIFLIAHEQEEEHRFILLIYHSYKIKRIGILVSAELLCYIIVI